MDWFKEHGSLKLWKEADVPVLRYMYLTLKWQLLWVHGVYLGATVLRHSMRPRCLEEECCPSASLVHLVPLSRIVSA